MARSIGQVAISVVATLIATQIYGGLHRIDGAGAPARPPSMTTGGKFDVRIAGAELPPLPEATRPTLSIVNWAITPVAPTILIDDIAWSGVDDGVAAPADPPVRAPRREAKDIRKGGAAIPTVMPPSRPAVIAAADVVPVPTPTPAVSSGGIWSLATGMATTTVRSIGALGGSVLSLGGSAMALGGSALGHLVPDRH